MRKRRIKDFAKVRRGASPRPIDDPRFFGGAVGWVRIADVTASKKYLRQTTQQLSPLGESMSVRVGPGDLILSICATLGRPILVQIPACIHDGFVHISDFKDEADAEFLYYQFEAMRSVFERAGQSGTQTNINSGIVENTEILLPEKPTQEVIARILATIDRAIEQTEALLAKQQRIKAGLMHDLLTRGLDSKGQLRDPATHRFKNTPLGSIPGEWSVVPLESLVSSEAPICYGIVQVGPDTPGGVPTIAIRDLGEISIQRLHHTERDREDKFVRSRVIGGDLLLSIKATTGELDVVPTGFSGNISRDLARIRLHPTESPTFFKYQLQSDAGQRRLGAITVGTTRREISIIPLRNIMVARPEPDEQLAIAEGINRTEQDVAALSAELEKHRRQKTGLMQDLLTGRVPVTPLLAAKTS